MVDWLNVEKNFPKYGYNEDKEKKTIKYYKKV